jgi:hypothetical protein
MDSEDNKKQSASSHYKSFLVKYPLLANSVQAAVINAAGVLTSQAVIPALNGQPVQINWLQVLNFAIIGVIITFLFICAYIPVVFSHVKSKVQLLIISTLFGTFIINAVFVVSLGMLEELFDPTKDICLKPIFARIFTSDFVKGGLESRIVFLPADVLTIFFASPTLQPLISNLAGYIWTVVLALRN